VLLILLATEAFVLVPWAFEVATLVDLLGTGVFELFFAGLIFSSYSQVRAFAKGLRERVLILFSPSSTRGLPSAASILERIMYDCYRAKIRTLQGMVWSATLASFLGLTVLLIKKMHHV
jgi:hypothetical protein